MKCAWWLVTNTTRPPWGSASAARSFAGSAIACWAAVEQLGELALGFGVVDDVVEVRLVCVLQLVHLVEETLLLLFAVLAQFTQLVDGAGDLLVLNAVDDELRELGLHEAPGHGNEVVRVRDELAQPSTADEDVDDGLAGEGSGLLQFSDDVGQVVAASEFLLT